MSSRCFTYGSLMCADIMTRVCGHATDACNAVLAGHSRHPVRGEDYPAIVPDEGGRVVGRLYAGIGASAWERLDSFEGHQYERRLVTVTLQDEQQLDAWAYVFRPQYGALLGPGDWDFEAFVAGGKRRFEARYLGFDQRQQQ